MFKHEVAYVDFNGNERKEDLYFHLSTPEVVRLEAEIGMPMADYIRQLSSEMDVKTLLVFLEKIMLGAYGKKTADGRSFQKSEEIRREFEYSNAYAELFEEMITNPELAEKFGQGIADSGKNRKNQVEPQVVRE